MFKKILILITLILNAGISLQAMHGFKSKLKSNAKRIENYRVRKALKECYGLSEPSEELQVEIDKALDLLKMERNDIVILTNDNESECCGASGRLFAFPKAAIKTGSGSMPVVILNGDKKYEFYKKYGVPAQVGTLYHELGHAYFNHVNISSILCSSAFACIGISIIEDLVSKKIDTSKNELFKLQLAYINGQLIHTFFSRNMERQERQADRFAINTLLKQNNIVSIILSFLFYLNSPEIAFLYPLSTHPDKLDRAQMIIKQLIKKKIDLFALPIPDSYKKKNEVITRFLVCLKHYFPKLYTQALDFHNNKVNTSYSSKNNVEIDKVIEEDCMQIIKNKENRAQKMYFAMGAALGGGFLGGMAYRWYKS